MESEVYQFAINMQNELWANQYKGDWRNFAHGYLTTSILNELEGHRLKLLDAVASGDKAKIKEYAADCANILMFLNVHTNSLY